MSKEEIVKRLLSRWKDPFVFLFKEKSKALYDEVIQELEQKGVQLVDLNQYSVVTSEDYQMSAKDAYFKDDSGSFTVADLLMDDAKKQQLIIRSKLWKLEETIEPNTVLYMSYNDLFKREEKRYEIIRSWLKDGYVRNQNKDIAVRALVFLEKEDAVRDFCPYGVYVD